MDIVVLFLFSILGGCISAATVVLLARAAQDRFGFHRESFMSVLGLLGFAVIGLGKHYDLPWLGGIGLLLSGWLFMIPIVIAAVLLWHGVRLVLGAFRGRSAED